MEVQVIDEQRECSSVQFEAEGLDLTYIVEDYNFCKNSMAQQEFWECFAKDPSVSDYC